MERITYHHTPQSNVTSVVWYSMLIITTIIWLLWRALWLPPPVTGSWAAARAALLFGTARVPAPELPRYQAWHLFPRYTVSPRRIFGGCRNFDIDAVMNTQYSGSHQCKKCLLIVEMSHLWTFKLNESLNFQSLKDLFTKCDFRQAWNWDACSRNLHQWSSDHSSQYQCKDWTTLHIWHSNIQTAASQIVQFSVFGGGKFDWTRQSFPRCVAAQVSSGLYLLDGLTGLTGAGDPHHWSRDTL